MKILAGPFLAIPTLLLCVGVISRAGQNETAKRQPTRPQRDYPVKPVPFTAVHLNDSFWLPRIEINRTVTIPFAFQKCEETGRVENFNRAAAALKGELKRARLDATRVASLKRQGARGHSGTDSIAAARAIKLLRVVGFIFTPVKEFVVRPLGGSW